MFGGTPMAEDLVYALYAFLAFSEVLVLFASAIGVLVFIACELIGMLGSLADAAVSYGSRSGQHSVKTLRTMGAAAGARSRVIPGGHNERF